MATSLVMYSLDITGVNPQNLVSDESVDITQVSTDNKILIVPKYGYFYTNSFVLKDNGVEVPKSKYRFTEYFHKASFKYGKQICGSILVDVTGLSGDLVYSYQVLGGDNSRSTSNLIEVFYD